MTLAHAFPLGMLRAILPVLPAYVQFDSSGYGPIPKVSSGVPKIPLRNRASPTGPKIPLRDGEEKSKISRATGVLMIAIAAVIDFVQFLLTFVPIVGWVASSLLSICTWLLFGIWFSHLHVSLFNPERILGTGGAMLGEALPFFNGFPWWTFRIAVAVKYEWLKESAV